MHPLNSKKTNNAPARFMPHPTGSVRVSKRNLSEKSIGPRLVDFMDRLQLDVANGGPAMANALVIQKSHLPSRRDTFRAAQYVRMSTDKQRYSIQNQAAVIAAYAHAHNLQIIKTYKDEGESGLRIKNRMGLRQLIADVSSGEADFSHVLVYDVSRWGRFQDTDESAHYEFVCKRAGVQVA